MVASAPPRPAGPVAQAVAPLAAGPISPAAPAAFLAGLVDLRGGVCLAEALDALAELPAGPGPAAAPEALRAQLRDGCQDVQRRLDEAFSQAFKARYRLPAPERILHVLAEAGALGERKGAPLKAGLRTLWAPFGDFFDTQLKRGRFALRDLGVALAPALASQGAQAAQLVALDAALAEATAVAREALYRRIPYALERRFTEQVRRAVRALPAEPVAADLAPWFDAGGCLHGVVDQGEALVRAVLAEEIARLAAWVEAALSAG